ncbi:hypothetical protein [Methylocapsa palsarum]|uniref:YCII-related domain-containing protein n=1 Tax=Methylocapsa palsarum TaxID=1612308 RepID=A0A1I4ATQ6_9HYPH|nr:hypothetical protein [Methylocapsa palsarum]SFK59251.1 hypothetical protein SAMN05444581_11188 [Methylocapsa palsarum]
MASDQQKFLVLFLIPAAVMDGWAQTDPAEKKAGEEKLKGEWDRWMNEHSSMILSTEAAGKTKRVTSGGVADARNDIIIASIVQADSHDAAAKAFENHPHFQIPQASIEIMPLKQMGG